VLFSAAAVQASPVVRSIGIVKDAGGDIVTIECEGKPEYEFFLVDGTNLVVDIFDYSNDAWPTAREVGSPFLRTISISEHFSPRPMVRVLLDLEREAAHEVKAEGGRIVVTLGRPGYRTPPPSPRAAAEPAVMTAMNFIPMDDRSRVRIVTTKPVEYRTIDSEDPRIITMEISGVRLSPIVKTRLDLSTLERELVRIDVREKEVSGQPRVVLTATLKVPAPFRVLVNPEGLILDVNKTAPAVPSTVAAPAAPLAPYTAPMVHYGKKISLDLVGADIKDVLRLVSDVSGINFVAGDEVRGTVTMRLIEVPWEVALSTILMTNQPPLAQVPITENIVRVTTEEMVARETEKRMRQREFEKKAKEAEQELEPLVMKEFDVSYAKLDGDFLSILEEFASHRVRGDGSDGLLRADLRTNTVLVKDLAPNVDQIERVIRKLDTPVPTVVVEARIVEVTSTAAEQLGIQWGLDFAADAAHGNALPFRFPNSVGITGGVEGEDGTLMVNLPASNPAGAIGLSFGHIANTLSLDLTLQALEQLNEVKILSQPRVLVVQNQEATINLGQQLPIPATDAEGNRTVTFQDVGIKLVVTPQVTNDGKVFMDINVEKSSRGENVPTTEGTMFSINSRRAQTQVLIENGETAVIGGLTVEETSQVDTSVPKLSDVPYLGWLFRSKDHQTRRDEMMIFLTPRIVSPS
jgi:type IV pilus assembly protein PilQ